MSEICYCIELCKFRMFSDWSSINLFFPGMALVLASKFLANLLYAANCAQLRYPYLSNRRLRLAEMMDVMGKINRSNR